MTFDNWYLFPISILIATTAMASGIGGAVFFSPLFMLVLRLEPVVAVGTALATELFGFSSGVYAYWRQRLIDYKVGVILLMFSVPAAVLGTMMSDAAPAALLKTIFAVGVIFVGSQLFTAYRREQAAEREIESEAEEEHESELVDRRGRVFRYTVCKKKQGMAFAAVGGALLGMISVGLAELQEYHLVVRCRIPAPVAVATSIFIVVVSVLTASVGHFYNFATRSDPETLREVLNVVLFTIPGVIVGGQIGPLVQARVDPELVKLILSFLFAAVGILLLFATWL